MQLVPEAKYPYRLYFFWASLLAGGLDAVAAYIASVNPEGLPAWVPLLGLVATISAIFLRFVLQPALEKYRDPEFPPTQS